MIVILSLHPGISGASLWVTADERFNGFTEKLAAKGEEKSHQFRGFWRLIDLLQRYDRPAVCSAHPNAPVAFHLLHILHSWIYSCCSFSCRARAGAISPRSAGAPSLRYSLRGSSSRWSAATRRTLCHCFSEPSRAWTTRRTASRCGECYQCVKSKDRKSVV